MPARASVVMFASRTADKSGRNGIGLLAMPEHDTSKGRLSLTRQGKLSAETRSHVTNDRCYRLPDTPTVNLDTLPQPSQSDQSADLTAPRGAG